MHAYVCCNRGEGRLSLAVFIGRGLQHAAQEDNVKAEVILLPDDQVWVAVREQEFCASLGLFFPRIFVILCVDSYFYCSSSARRVRPPLLLPASSRLLPPSLPFPSLPFPSLPFHSPTHSVARLLARSLTHKRLTMSWPGSD